MQDPDLVPKKKYTPEAALLKLESFCAYQERCQQEVRDKLYSFGLSMLEVENIIADLITRNFLNEERFAIAYAGGKFRIKNWGRNKIKYALKLKKISDYCIKKGINTIDPEEYFKVLVKLAGKKWEETKGRQEYQRKSLVFKYLLSRGFESDLINEAILIVVGEQEML